MRAHRRWQAAASAAVLLASLLATAPSAGAHHNSSAKPGDPTNFTATALSATKIRLTWDVPAHQGSGGTHLCYAIFRTKPGNNLSIGICVTGNSFDYSVDANTTYQFRINSERKDAPAATAFGNYVHSNQVKTPVLSAPGEPTALRKAAPGFSRGAGSAGTTALDWDAPSDPGSGSINGYEIRWRKGTSGGWTSVNVNTANPSAAQRTVSHGNAGDLHQFRVGARNVDGQISDFSNLLEVAGRPGAPTLATPEDSDVTADSVTLSWTAPSSTGGKAINNYLYQYSDDGGANWRYAGETSGTSAMVSSLAQGAAYRFRVRSQNPDRDSWFSNQVNATTKVDRAATPGPVRNLRNASGDLPAEQRTTRLKFAWDAPNTGGDFGWYSYNLAPAGGSVFRTGGSSSNTSDTQPGLHPGTSYDYRVRACKDSTQADCSAYETLTATTDYIKPDAPPGSFTATALDNNNNGTDRLTWTAPTNTGVTGYSVQRRQAGQTNWQGAETVTGTQHDFAKEGSTSGSAYEYRVKANTPSGTDDSDWAATRTVAGRPGAINDLSASASTSQVSVALSWTAPSNGGKNLTGYRVEWREDASGDWNANPAAGGTMAPGSASTFTVNAGHGLQPGTVYDFRVRADNPDRSSFFSNTAQANQATLSIGASITSPSSLTEGELDGAVLTVDLVGTQFVGTLVNQHSHLALNSPIGGLSIASVERVHSTRARLTLAFTGDFSNDSNLGVIVRPSANTNSGESDLVSPNIPVTAEAAPPQVTGVSASGGVGQVSVNWAAVSGAHGYKVQWKSGSQSFGAGRQIVIADGAATTATIPGLSPSTQYTVRVIATKRLAPDGPPSAEATATTDAVSAMISSPSSLTERALDGARLTVDLFGTEYASSLTASDFGLLPQGVAGLSVASVGRVSSTRAVLTLAFSGNFDSDLSLQVAVDGSAHTSSGTLFTGGITVSPAPIPPTVDGVSADGGPGSLDVSWRSVSNADGYVVQWKQASSSSYDRADRVTVRGGSATRAGISGLLGDTAYDVRVYAVSDFAPDGPIAVHATATTLPAHAFVSGTDPSPLSEANLDGATVTVELFIYDRWARQPMTVGQVRASGVPGVRVTGVSRLSDYRASVTLAYDGSDFDSDAVLRLDFSGAHTSISPITAVVPVRAVVEQPPGEVTNVRVSPGPLRLEVRWDAAEGADGYVVRWRPTSLPVDTPEQTPELTPRPRSCDPWYHQHEFRNRPQPFTIPGLQPGCEYAVTVIATKRKADNGPPSVETRGVTPAFAYSYATSPQRLGEANLNGAVVTIDLEGAEWRRSLSWYRFLVSGVSGVWVDWARTVSPSRAEVALRYNGTDFDTDAELRLLVRADMHSWTENLHITVPVTAIDEAEPGQVMGVTASGGDDTVAVSWGTVVGATAYKLEWKAPGESYSARNRVITPIWWHTIRGLEPGQQYTVRVAAWMPRTGYRPWSAETTATTGPPPEPATSPQQRTEPGSVTVSTADISLGEAGPAASYTVVLDAEPTDDVVIAVSSDNADVTVQPSSLTFTPANWQTAQTVTVVAAADDDAAHDTASLSHTASGAEEYAGVEVDSVSVAVDDDDTAAITVNPTSLTVNEGSSDAYDILLSAQPIGDVRISVFAAHGVTAQPSELTFTSRNWQTPQSVTVTAGHDQDTDNDTVWITHGLLVTAGSAYSGAAVVPVEVTVNDDDEIDAQAAQQQQDQQQDETEPDGQTGSDAQAAQQQQAEPATDREILAAFYEATGGDGWTDNANWLSDKPLRHWHGVTTNAQGEVVQLSLADNNVTGTLPAALGGLDALEVLSLDRNSIGGSLPAELGNLSSLTRLAMNRNQLTGAIPAELGSLSSLSIIGLARNQLTGTLPASLGNLGSLAKLSLHDNTALNGPLPAGFGTLTSLTRLAVSRTGLSGTLPQGLTGNQMRYLHCDDTSLCAPADSAFQTWLATVTSHNGPTCD